MLAKWPGFYTESHMVDTPGTLEYVGQVGGFDRLVFGSNIPDRAFEAAYEMGVHAEFSSSWAGAGKIARAVDICGVEQILYGSDIDLIDPAFVIGQYEGAGLTEPQLQAIYWDNPRRVLGLTS